MPKFAPLCQHTQHVNMQFIKSGSLILPYSLLSPCLALYDWYLHPYEQKWLKDFHFKYAVHFQATLRINITKVHVMASRNVSRTVGMLRALCNC